MFLKPSVAGSLPRAEGTDKDPVGSPVSSLSSCSWEPEAHVSVSAAGPAGAPRGRAPHPGPWVLGFQGGYSWLVGSLALRS